MLTTRTDTREAPLAVKAKVNVQEKIRDTNNPKPTISTLALDPKPPDTNPKPKTLHPPENLTPKPLHPKL